MKNRLAWFPNLLTMGNLFCGFLAILFTIRAVGEVGKEAMLFYHYAMVTMLIAGVFDFFDGYTARKLGVSSEIGRELDSLADVVSFGIAPAVLLYEHALKDTQIFGIVAVAFYVCCAAYRLARHNIIASTGRKPYFTGMPIEGGTAILIAFVLSQQGHITSLAMKGTAMASVLIAGLLMVSTLRFTANVSLPVRIGALIVMVLGIVYPGIWTLLIPFAYIAYAIISNLVGVQYEESTIDASLLNSATVSQEPMPVAEHVTISE